MMEGQPPWMDVKQTQSGTLRTKLTVTGPDVSHMNDDMTGCPGNFFQVAKTQAVICTQFVFDYSIRIQCPARVAFTTQQ